MIPTISQTQPQRRLEELYEHFWPAHDGIGFAESDDSLSPRPPIMLFDLARELGVQAENTVLDVGCGRGNHALALAERCDCQVVGIDPVPDNVRHAQGAALGPSSASASPLAGKTAFLQGSVESLPLGEATFDLIWSRNMLVHVAHLRLAVAECARVLKPGGVMIVEASVQTERMEPREAARLYRSLSIVPANMSSSRLERAFRGAGLRIHSREVMGGEPMEFFEQHERRCSKELVRLTRLIRAKDKLIADMGETRYEVTLAASQWVVYHLLGKLSTTLYSLRKKRDH